MYGKSYESMYKGSMYGAGLNVWGVWNYVITNTHFGVIEINPVELKDILGCKTEEVEDALIKLCRPDPRSRSKAEEGRKLVKEGEFQYRVVNWAEYQKIKSGESLRQYNREAKQRERDRKRREGGNTTMAERHYIKGVSDGTIDPETGNAL